MAELYKYQKDCVAKLLDGKHIICAGMGMGKNPMSVVWAVKKCEETGKDKILVVTTASKAKTTDHWDDLCKFCTGKENSLSSFSVISWHKLKAWVEEHTKELDEWVVIFDEIQRSKGYSTGMGKAFLKITKTNDDWAGFTGTPGDTWDAFISYFVATKKTTCKTHFLNRYANIQTYKGYPEIVSWRYENELRRMWSDISYAPDTSIVAKQLPKEKYETVTMSKPKGYVKVLKTRENENGEFLDTSGALVAELRRICFTKDKQQWMSDFVEGLESGAVIFYNYIATGDKLEEIIKKALPKGARVWRIDGRHHEIPTASTIGKKDMVLCQWQSGSEALNLQFLHYWVGVELCYSYSTFMQSIGRIKRIGQKMPMTFYLLVTEGTIEQDVLKCLRDKREFSERNWCLNNNLIEKGEE